MNLKALVSLCFVLVTTPAWAGSVCADIFDSNLSRQNEAALSNLDTFIVSMFGRTKLKPPSFNAGDAFGQYYYRGTRLHIQKSTHHPEVTIARGLINVPANAISGRTTNVKSNPSSRSRTWFQPLNVASREFQLSETSAELLVEIPKRGGRANTYRLATLRAGVEIFNLETLSTDTSVFVLEFEPYKAGDGYGRISLSEFNIPYELPQQKPVFQKTFDLSDLDAATAPRILPYGRYVLVGGSQLALLDPQTQSLINLRTPEDLDGGSIIDLQMVSGGKVRVVRERPTSPGMFRVDAYILDLARLKP